MPSSLTGMWRSTFSLLALMGVLSGCGGSGDSDDLESAIEIGQLDTVDMYISSEEGKVIFEPGESWQFFAISVDSKGNKEAIDEGVSWSTDDPGLIAVNGKGLVEMGDPVGSQEARIFASFGEFSDELNITVSSAELVQVDIAPEVDPLPECQSTEFSATGIYVDGSERPLLNGLTWSTDEPDLATFDGNRLGTRNSGTVNTTVDTENGITGEYLLTITDTLTAIRVSSGEALRLFVGDEMGLTASGDYSDGSIGVDVSENSTWTVDDPETATLDQQVVTGLKLGSTTLEVSCGGLAQVVVVDVVEFDDILIVDPKPDLGLVEGEERSLELYKTLSNDDVDAENVADEAKWSIVKGDSIADIDESGVLTMSDDFSSYDSDEIRIEAELDDFFDEIEITISK